MVIIMIKRTVSFFENICSRSLPLARLYCLPYRHVVKKEIELAGIGPGDIVLNIGCGAIPFTAIFVAGLSGAKVIAADKNPKAAHLARKCIHRVGLAHLIKTIECDCSQWVPEDFTVALVALQAEPKEAILNKIFSKGENRRIVSRAASRFFQKHYSLLPQAYEKRAEVVQNMKTFDRSVLFVT